MLVSWSLMEHFVEQARPIEMLLEADGEGKGAGSKEPDLTDHCAFGELS